MDKINHKYSRNERGEDDKLREELYFERDSKVEFGVEQAHGYPFNGGWVYPDLEKAESIVCDKDEDPLKKFTK